MNQDFYAMSREPDPQFPNNVFQHLMASSITELRASQEISTSVITGREPMRFNEEHEGIEASHILQSLSAAEDIRRG